MSHRITPSAPVSLAAFACLALLAGAGPGTVAAQEPPPDGEWLTFRTPHFRVTFQPDLEPLARQAGAVAERTHAVLSRELTAPPDIIDLVVTDHVDYSNGLARLFPSNRILVFARPAAAEGDFFARDWIELVVAHEVVHSFHFDESGGLGEAVRTVLGRVPVAWPVFPSAGTPSWNVEGLATHYESRLTGAGRVQASFHDMIIRTAALEDRIPDLDALSAPSPVWPGGNRSYVYGARVMRYIADRYGPEAHAALVDATAGSVWPTFLRFDHVAREALGRPFDAIYDDWRAAAVDSARAMERRVRARGLTPTAPVAGRGPYAVKPRVSPDGGRLAYTASDWRSDPATRVLGLATGGVRTVARRNQFGMLLSPPAWLPDGSGFVVSQLEYRDSYRLFSDLWRVGLDGRETRLSSGLRLDQPDVGPDGRIAAIQSHHGALRLAVYDPAGDSVRVVVDAEPGQAFDAPRWSPDGRWIAAGRHAAGRTDLVVVDAASGAVTAVTDDTPLDAAPAWSPDGRWLLWWSDRTGIPNIMAVPVADGRPAGTVRQVTNVLGGAIDPEVDPDGETLYVAAYGHEGWRIEALPFDTAAWLEAPPPGDRYADAALPPPGTGAGPEVGGEATAYSPRPTLRPYYWLPTWELLGSGGSDRLRFIGAAVEGWDVLRRHTWGLRGMGDIDTGRFQGSGFWVYRGLGSPELFLSASRDWDRTGYVRLVDNAREPVVAVEDEVAAGVAFLYRRWRRSASLRVAGELERRAYEGRNLSRSGLAARGVALPEIPTLAGLSVGPAFQNTRVHPFSISLEDGVRASLGVGRWWRTGSWERGYDELTGRLAGYLSAPVWGFADHVLTVRGAGLLRTGPRAPLEGVGGPPVADLVVAGTDASAFPVRGFDEGDRVGTRAWTAAAEWRFPIHLRDAPGSLLGFSLVSISGAVFADAGSAWCTDADRSRAGLAGCADSAVDPLVSAGAELSINFGAFHNAPARLVLGLAQPIQGPGDRPVFYLGTLF